MKQRYDLLVGVMGLLAVFACGGAGGGGMKGMGSVTEPDMDITQP